MGFEGRRTVENRIEKQKGRVIESDKKEEITSTEFPEGGNTIYTNRTPGIPTGDLHSRLLLFAANLFINCSLH